MPRIYYYCYNILYVGSPEEGEASTCISTLPDYRKSNPEMTGGLGAVTMAQLIASNLQISYEQKGG